MKYYFLNISETPEVDLEKFKPVKYELNTSVEVSTPSKWAAGSEPLCMAGPTQTQPGALTQSLNKRKREDPYFNAVSTPETPYGAFLHGPNPNTQTRYEFKKKQFRFSIKLLILKHYIEHFLSAVFGERKYRTYLFV